MPNLDARILIVDDMAAMRTLMSKTLKTLGYKNLQEAPDGADAWIKLTETTPQFQIIISDLVMPISNGIDLLKRVRGSKLHCALPFIMLSAKGEYPGGQNPPDNKITSYILKPINPIVLNEKLTLLLGA